MRFSTSSVLLSALLTAAVVAPAMGCRGWTSDKPPVHLNPNMDTQEKGKPFRSSDVFADGRMMQTPPAGTVARGYLHDDDTWSLGTSPDNNPVTKFPARLERSDANKARGAARFAIYCAPCHGKAGDGQGTVASRLLVKPPSFLDKRLTEMPIGQIYSAILNGVNGANMPSYAAQIPEQDRWDIVLHVREIQKAHDPAMLVETETLPASMLAAAAAAAVQGASAEKGQALYTTKTCVACHSLDGTKIVGPSFKGVWGRQEKTDKGDVVVDMAYLTESIRNPNAQIVDGYPPAMPVLDLTDEDIESIALFMQTLK